MSFSTDAAHTMKSNQYNLRHILYNFLTAAWQLQNTKFFLLTGHTSVYVAMYIAMCVFCGRLIVMLS